MDDCHPLQIIISGDQKRCGKWPGRHSHKMNIA